MPPRGEKWKRLDYTVSRSSFGGRPRALHERRDAGVSAQLEWADDRTALSPLGVSPERQDAGVNQDPDALRGRARWQGSYYRRATRYLSQLTTLVSRVAAPPVLSRDLHSRIRCLSHATSAHRFAAIAGHSTDDEETGPAWIDPLQSERAGRTSARITSLFRRKPAVIRARPQIQNRDSRCQRAS